MQKSTQLISIMAEKGILIYGVCPFRAVENRLIRCRASVRLPDHPKSVIMAAFPYNPAPNENENRIIARYAAVPDYHRSVGRLLSEAGRELSEAFSGHTFEPFVDNSPIPEVWAAALCGMGVIGQNGLLIHPEYGSWVFLGAIVTDLVLEPTGSGTAACVNCGICKRVCPGGAIGGHGVDRNRCLSALTQKKGKLSGQEIEAIKANGLIWGCDRCQECCPLNQKVRPAPLTVVTEHYHPDFTEDASLQPRAWDWRGKAVIDRNINIIKSKMEYGI